MENCALDLAIRRPVNPNGVQATPHRCDIRLETVESLTSSRLNHLELGESTPPKRRATEGSDSIQQVVVINASNHLQSGEKNLLGNNTKSIDMTLVADRFLQNTMDVLAHKEEIVISDDGMTCDRARTLSCPSSSSYLPPQSNAQTGTSVIAPIPAGMNKSASFPSMSSPSLTGLSTDNVSNSKNSARGSRPPLLPPCRVCGDRASGYHYGVNTCEACKGFFRRSICKSEPYVCNGNGDCKTMAGKRTACSHCRFKRCIEVGMSKNAIKTGRYTHELRSKNIMEVKRLQKQKSEESEGSVDETDSGVGEALYVEYKRDLFKRTLLEETLNLLMEGQKLLFEYLDDYYNDELIKELQLQVYNGFLEKKNKIAERIKTQEMSTSEHELPGPSHCQKSSATNGQINSSGYAGVSEIKPVRCETEQSSETLSCILTDNKKTGVDAAIKTEVESVKADVMSKIIAAMEQGVQGMLGFAKSLPGFDELPKDDQAALLKASRFDIWYIGHIRCFNVELRVGACEWQFHAEELAQVWGNDLVDLAFILSRVAQSLELTKQETAVLRAVCLTFSDRCVDLQQRARVDEMHMFMLDVFRYVSCKRHNNYNKWFTKVINFLVLLREFGVKFEKVSSQLKLDWSILKDNPLLLSVFLS